MMKNNLILLAAFLAIAIAADVNWPKQTEESLRLLPTTDFTDLTGDLLKTITPEAIQGYTAAQFAATPSVAWSGLTPFQFYNFTVALCTSLNKEFFQNVPVASFQNFTVSCVTGTPALAFQGFNAERLSQVSPNSLSFLTAEKVFALPDDSAKLLSGPQVSVFGTDGGEPNNCVGLRSGFLNNINSTNSLPALGADCAKFINATQFSGLSVETVRGLNENVAVVLTQEQVKELGDNCAGVTPQFLAKLDQIQNATTNCIKKLPADAFAQIQVAQVRSLSIEQVNSIQKAHFTLFNPVASAGFSQSQVAAFNTESCGGIPSNFAANLRPVPVGGLTPDCVKSTNGTFFAQFSAPQSAQLSLEVAKVLSEDQILNFNPTAAAGFEADHINVLGYETACKGLEAQFVSFISVPSIRALPAACVTNARDAAFSLLSAAQVKNMTVDSFSGFRTQQVEQFSLLAAPNVSAPQAAKWGVDTGCAGLGGLVASKLATDVFPVITKDCLAHTNSSFFSKLPDASVMALPAETFAGIQERHFEQMIARVARDLTEFQTVQFSNDACKGITAKVLGALLPASGLKGLTQGCFSNVPGYSFIKFTPAQLNSVNCTSLNADQVAHLPVDTFASISIVCVQELTPAAFNTVTPTQLAALPDATVSLLTASQLSQFSPLSVKEMKLTQIDALNTNATAGFTGDQLGNLTLQYKLEFVNRIPLLKWTPNVQSAMDYVAKVGVLFEGEIPYSTFTNSTTWIQLANLQNGSFVLDSNFVARTYPVTFMGLRPLYVAQLKDEAFPTFTPEQTAYLLPAVVAQVSASQVKGLTPAAFGALYPASFNSLSSDALKALSNDQIKAIPASVLKDCTFADNLQKSGRTEPLSGDAKSNYDACIAKNTGGDKSGLTGGQIAGIVIGVIAGVAVIGGAIFYFVRRKKANYQAI